MRRRDLLVAAGAGSILAGCGFRPLYAPAAGGAAGAAQTDLAAVAVPNLPERGGQLMREALQARLDPGNMALAKRYELSVGFGVATEGIGILPDSSVTRNRLIGTASWILQALDPARTRLAGGNARAVDGYDVIDNQFFASVLESETLQRRLADRLAEQIVLQVAAYFDHRARSSHPA
jgi:LPS-assembly lipoprotein